MRCRRDAVARLVRDADPSGLGRADRHPGRRSRHPPAAPCPTSTIPPWDGKERLNILLIGADERQGERTYNTDTLIVVSIDPVTKQVAMFSLPRDTVDVPIPPGPARDVFGLGLHAARSTAGSTAVRGRSDLFPGNERDARLQRAQGDPRQPVRARHQVLRRGQLRGLPEGRRRDGRGDHQRPGPGLRRPLPGDRGRPATGLHPDRHPAHDRRRGAPLRPLATHLDRLRPRRHASSACSLSLREQADPQALIPTLPELVAALKKAVKTDIPVDQLAPLLGPRLGGRHEEHPLVRVHAAVLPAGIPVQPARLHHRPERRPDPGRGQADAFTIDPADEATRQTLAAGGGRACGSSTARRTAPAGPTPRRLPRATTGSPPRRRASSRRARSRPTRRSSSTTAPRRRSRTRSPTSRRRSG